MSFRQRIEEIIKKSDVVFKSKWEVLCQLKQMEFETGFHKSFIDFQIELADTLFEIETFRLEIITEEKRLKSNMNRYNKKWFISKMKTLSHYKKVLLRLNIIGKSIGDAFAFWFYRFDLELLNEHYDHQRTLYPPLGVGGKGELGFIREIRAIDGKFGIYHGITNILRIGDVSFFDLKKLNIISIGEIKTKKTDVNKFDIQVTVLGHKSRDAFKNIVINKRKKSPSSYFNKERFERQLESMGKALNVYNPPKEEDLRINQKINEEYNCKYIDDLYSKSSSTNVTFIKASEGLMLSGIKTRHRSPITKFLASKEYTPKEEDTKIGTEYLKSIIDFKSQENSMIYGQLQYNKKHLDNSTRGTVPLFWMPINIKALKGLYFGDFEVSALYNPIHLISKLRSDGVTVQSKYCEDIEVNGTIQYPKITAMYFDLYLPYILNHLQSENSILNIFETIKREFSNKEKKGSVKAEIKIQQFISPFMDKPSR